MNALTPLALANADVIRAIAGGAHDTLSAAATALGRDASNLSKTLKALQAAGLITDGATLKDRTLTDAGRAALAALDRLDGEPRSPNPPDGFVELYHGQIVPDPGNARTDWDSEEAMAADAALAELIAEQGLLNELKVGPAEPSEHARVNVNGESLPFHQLIGGERRWRAIGRLIEDGRWPQDRKILCKVRDEAGIDREFLALGDNLAARKLRPIEEAEAFERLVRQGAETDEIAARVGVSIRQVQMRVQLMKLPEADRERMRLPTDHPDYLSPTAARELVQKPKITPKMLLALIELADASERFPFCGGCKIRVDVDLGALPNLVHMGLVARSLTSGGTGHIAYLTDSGWAHLESLGKRPTAETRADILLFARSAVVSSGPANELAALDNYASRFLNLPKPPPTSEPFFTPVDTTSVLVGALGPPAAEVVEQGEGLEPSEETQLDIEGFTGRPDSAPIVLSVAEQLILVELQHAACEIGLAVDDTGQPAVPVGAYWHDRLATSGPLSSKGLIKFVMGGEPARWHAYVTRAGEDWLLAHDLAEANPDEAIVEAEHLAKAREAARCFTDDGYVTEWLNLDPDAAAEEAPLEVVAPLSAAPDAPDDEETRDADILAAAEAIKAETRAGAPWNPWRFAELARRCGMTLPLEICAPDLYDDVTLVGADEAALAIIDPEAERSHNKRQTMAELLAMAINRCAGEFERPQPAIPWRRSITPDFIVCLDDGRRVKNLATYIRLRFGLSPTDYITKWQLPRDYPMLAPNWAQNRDHAARALTVAGDGPEDENDPGLYCSNCGGDRTLEDDLTDGFCPVCTEPAPEDAALLAELASPATDAAEGGE